MADRQPEDSDSDQTPPADTEPNQTQLPPQERPRDWLGEEAERNSLYAG